MKRLINIYGNGKTRSIEFLEVLYLKNQDKVIRMNKDTFETELEKYRAYGISESNRGAKFHDAYVDESITLGEYEHYIKYQQLRVFEEDAGFIRLYSV